MGIAALVVVAAALGYALLGTAAARRRDAAAKLEAAGCTVKTVDGAASPAITRSLTPEGTSTKWNTAPPTSGPHYQCRRSGARTRSRCYPAQVVHNLEHGGIFIQYGKDVPQADGRRAEGVLRRAPERHAARAAPEPRLEDRDGRVDDEQRDARRTPAPRTSPSARRSTRRRSRRSSRRTSSRARSGSRRTRRRPAPSPGDRPRRACSGDPAYPVAALHRCRGWESNPDVPRDTRF